MSAVVDAPGAAASGAGPSAYDFAFISLSGEPLALDQFRGRPMLVVNTASHCGFARQFMGLQTLWQRYRDQGLVVLGVPSGDFADQEFDSGTEALHFCEAKYQTDFPLTEKTTVCGPDAHPFYRWANNLAGTFGRPRWNFHKYLIGIDGNLKAWYPTVIGPTSKRLRGCIEAELEAARATAGA